MVNIKRKFIFTLLATLVTCNISVVALAKSGETANRAEIAGVSRPAKTIPRAELPVRPDINKMSEKEFNELNEQIDSVHTAVQNSKDEALATREDAMTNLKENPPSELPGAGEGGDIARAIMSSGIDSVQRDIVAGDFYYVLISASLTDDEIMSMLKDYDGRSDVSLVIRGVTEKNNLLEEMTHWQKLVLDSGAEVSVTLDPFKFLDYNVSSVPAIIHEKNGEFVSSVLGITSIDYLKDKKGALGKRGPVKDVKEVSLMTLIEEGLENLDGERMVQKAIDRYWSNQSIIKFPEVKSSSTRYIDPSVIIPENITGLNGEIVAARGQINPLDIMPFNMKLIFFDAAEKWQRDFARAQYNNTEEGITPILITTNIYGNGWQTFEEQEQYGKNATLYFIQEGMADRFGIFAVPAIVTAKNRFFVIDEYAKQDFEQEKSKVKIQEAP